MIAHLSNRSVLAVTGAERVSFLQGLVSNDVALAAPHRAVWAALLTPQGKWLADFFITAEGDALLLDVEAAQAAMIAQRLTRYRLRADIAITPDPRDVYVGWDTPPQGVPDPRLPEAGWRLVGAAAPDATEADYDRHRLHLGLPDGSRDLEAEKTTLLEAGFDELHGVSWTKGCYMGQELTARTKYRGLLKRRLVPVVIDGPVPPPGTAILRDGIDMGTIRSARPGIGLALLRLEAIADAPLTSGDATLTARPPPWMVMRPLQIASPA